MNLETASGPPGRDILTLQPGRERPGSVPPREISDAADDVEKGWLNVLDRLDGVDQLKMLQLQKMNKTEEVHEGETPPQCVN